MSNSFPQRIKNSSTQNKTKQYSWNACLDIPQYVSIPKRKEKINFVVISLVG